MSNTSYVSLPPDGAGKRIHTFQHQISGNTVQVQGMNIVDKDNPSLSAKVDSRGGIYTRFTDGDAILSSYNEQKISQDYIIGVYEHSVDDYDDLFYTNILSGGTSQYQNEYSSVKLSVTGDSGSEVTRTTNRYHYYQPGAPLLVILIASCSDSGKDGNLRSWGYYDDYNGWFFELNNNTLGVVMRSNTTGTHIDNFVAQTDWNIDKLNGTGVSGINIDITKAYQYFIAINWSNNIIKFGIYSQGNKIPCHQFQMSGISPIPLINRGSLPIRFSNKNINITAGVSELREIMGIVKCEMRDPNYTFWRFGDLGTERYITTNTPLISFRPKILLDNGNHNHINTFPETLSVYSSGSTIKIHIVSHNGTILSGDTWSLNSVGGPLECDVEAIDIDINSDKYRIMKTYYIQKDNATNIDLTDMFELNDEGILMSSDHITQPCISIVASTIGGGTALISTDFSYRALY